MNRVAIPIEEYELPGRVEFRFTGKRRKIAPRLSLPLRWPRKGTKERHEMFDAWHDAATGELGKASVNRDLADNIRPAIYWKEGIITKTNTQLAQLCGGCSLKTISRRIDQYVRLGLLRVEYDRPRLEKGRLSQTRTIRLAIPSTGGTTGDA